MNRLHVLALIPVLFALAPCVALSETSPDAKSDTGLEGVITISPTHGGPITPDEPVSKPLPKTVFVVQREDRSIAAEFETDEQGRFRISVPPGHYDVLAKDQKHKFGGHGPFPVDVVSGKMTAVQWDCDSGMR
jgi:hypothetical protein